MNIVLIDKNELMANQNVLLSDRRADQIISIHKAKEGDSIKVGEVNGKIGTGTIIKIEERTVLLQVNYSKKPPAPLPVTLFLSLPRPKTVKKVLPAVISMGVKNIYLVNSYRVEKSYWQSPVISEDNLLHLSHLGLEQGFDTIVPCIYKKKLFKPFVEDELPDIIKDHEAYIPHPNSSKRLVAAQPDKKYSLFIGPEGGFIPYEVNLLKSTGFTPITMGERILRVENAAVAALAKLF